jgi:hypothetical protein
MRGRSALLWGVAFLVTLIAGRYQERTGPTYPARGEVTLGNQAHQYELTRSWATGDQPIEVTIPDRQVHGRVRWRRYPTNDSFSVLEMQRESDVLRASLPHQPPAGKLEYQVELARGPERIVIPGKSAVTRFKGEVSLGVLIPHIAAIFCALLFMTRAGLEALVNGTRTRRYAWIGLALVILGGLILGPMVQKAAFDAYWTGVPWGWDLTDNKTLIMAIAWLFAAWRASTQPKARWSVLFGLVVALGVFLIPHSTWGSEIKWQ